MTVNEDRNISVKTVMCVSLLWKWDVHVKRPSVKNNCVSAIIVGTDACDKKQVAVMACKAFIS